MREPIVVMGIVIPTEATLRKYGLSVEAYGLLVEAQDGRCPICEKVPSTGRLVVDHYHARNYKDLPPEKRRKYVRGLLCWFCNHSYMGRGITLSKARNMVKYLEEFERRR